MKLSFGIPATLRWWLPLSYIAIAVVTAMSISLVLLLLLSKFYRGQEREYLVNNANLVRDLIETESLDDLPPGVLQSELASLAFLIQAQVRFLDIDHNEIADSGDPSRAVFNGSFSLGLETDNSSRQITTRIDDDGVKITSESKTEFTVDAPGSFDLEANDTGDNREPGLTTIVEKRTVISIGSNGDGPVSLRGFGVSPFFSEDPAKRSGEIALIPLTSLGRDPAGFIELSNGPAYGRNILRSVELGLFASGLVAIAVAAGLGLIWSRRITGPLQDLQLATARMSAGDLETRVDRVRSDELGDLSTAFNEMASRVESNVSALRRFVSDAAHQIHTPLTALRADLELASSENGSEQNRHRIDRALSQVFRIEHISSALLDLSRLEAGADAGQSRPADLRSGIIAISEMFASRAEQAGIEFTLDLPEGPAVAEISSDRATQLLEILVDNALKYTPEGGRITVGLSISQETATLTVRDNGPGMSPEDLPHIFERFRRGQNSVDVSGAGLGLTIARAIAENSGGTISADSGPGGTTLITVLPVSPDG